MKKFAVIETGGKQYKVAPQEKLKVEKLDAKEGSIFHFDKVLLRSDGDHIEMGEPYLSDGVEARIVCHGRHHKKIVFRYHSKTRYRKKKGHRQPYTEVEIVKI